MVEFDSPPDDMSKKDKTLDASTLSGYCLCSHQDKCVTSITQGTIAKRVTLDASMMKSNEKTFYFTYGWTPYYTSSKVKYVLSLKNVTFLNGKSVTRVKSVSRVVKCFSMSDPFAPRVDLGCPSLRGPSKIHSNENCFQTHEITREKN